MRPQELIAIKRDGGRLSAEQIGAFVAGICDGTWADYQIAAMIMAMFTRGLDESESAALVREMLHSGEILDFSDIDRPKADKHSTGGVGDKTSLIIAPVVASCGVAVPMISGRGLGHTGGTLDKLESILGYNVRLSNSEFHNVLSKCGFAMAGQTDRIAPADKKLYALRDATATVPYIPLIVASIMSKKLAEGLGALILDVKTGNGAFMQTLEGSKDLASALVETGGEFGVKTQAVVSDMCEPLGQFVGNAVEVYECIKILRGEAQSHMQQTMELSTELAARMLVLTDVSPSLDDAKRSVSKKIASGEALEKFIQNCELQGGDPSVFEDPGQLLDESIAKFEIIAAAGGYVERVDALAIGNAVVELGGGRTKADDVVDHGVGFECRVKCGQRVAQGEPLGTAYCRSAGQFESVRENLENAFTMSEKPVPATELVKAVIE